MPKKLLLLLPWLLLVSAPLVAQRYSPGPQVLTFLSDVDDSDQPYAIYLPKNFQAGKKYPLVISLHGAWSNHRVNLRRVFGQGNRTGESDAEATRHFPQFRDVDYIVASPYARGTMGYQGIPEKDVYAVLADVKKRFAVDEDRVYLTGLSMGGGGTLWLGLTRPDVWAAIAPVCPAAPDGTEDLAPNALNIPVHFFHGDQDPAVPVEVSRKWQKMLLHLDTNVEYVEYPGVQHNSWDKAYKDGAIFDWFAKYKRNRYPERVRFVTRAYKYSSAYWVHVDGLTPGTLAAIDARFAGKNHIAVTSSNVDGFTLTLEGHPSFTKALPLEVTVDGVVHRLKPRDTISFSRDGDSWKAARYVPPAEAKHPGLEGPIADAIDSRHIYVYGTADTTDKEEISRRIQDAAHAADWSTPELKLSLTLPVMSDAQLKPGDGEDANLILFGTRQTNQRIARLADRLPMELNPGAADYGLMFVVPDGTHYAVINSGLPFFTGIDTAKRPGLDFIGATHRALESFPDYILFKGSLGNVVAEGRFDRNWKLPAADAEKIKATGAVIVR